jgi:hypothetical protein
MTDINPGLSSHVETVALLSQLKQKPDDYINVTIELDDVDITSAETKATTAPEDKESAIVEALKYFKMIQQE